MGRGRVILIGGAALAALVISSCEEPPEQAIRTARAAVANLREGVKAGKWAPDELAAAETALQAAEKELSAQNSRLAFMRDYSKAAELFSSALVDMDLARHAAAEGKQAAEKQAREALEAAESAIGHARAARTIAPVARESRSAYEQLDLDLSGAEQRLEEVRNLIVAEEYEDAVAKAEEILEQVAGLIRAVSRGVRR